MDHSTPKSQQSVASSQARRTPCFYSPVAVAESPASKTPQCGNLTGIPRKIRDTAADIFNKIQEWNELHSAGTTVLKNIVNLKLSAIQDAKKNLAAASLVAGLQVHCDGLEDICKTMTVIVCDMKRKSRDLEALSQLVVQNDLTEESPTFVTWHAVKFRDVVEELYLSFNEELDVKTCIVQNVAHSKSKEALMFYVTAWVQQPYITSANNIDLEALLKETGHR